MIQCADIFPTHGQQRDYYDQKILAVTIHQNRIVVAKELANATRGTHQEVSFK
jgi:hypothetical protein